MPEAFVPAVQEYGSAVGMGEDERSLFACLTTPGSSHYLLNQADYYCVQTAVLVSAQV